MDADGGNVRRLTTAPGYDGGPFFSPDGQRIVWRRFDASGMNADVFTMKTDGSDVRQLTDFKAMSWAPFFHPSGKYVVFTSNKLGFENFELYLVDAAGEHEPVRATFTDGFDGLPVFSPDGKRLCWTSNRTTDKKSQIFLAEWNHEAALKALADAPRREEQGATIKVIEQRMAEMKQELAELKNRGIVVGTIEQLIESRTLTAAIAANELRTLVAWLADPAHEGRMTGTPGAAASADFIASYLAGLGLKPLGKDFFHPFEFDAGVKLIPDKNRLQITSDASQLSTLNSQLQQDFRPIPFSDSGEAEGEVVFAGYGLSVPDDGKGGLYNSYDGLDVKDKIVLILRYVPEAVDAKRRAQLNRYAGLRYKAMMARERGAKAVLFVNGPTSPQPGELVPLTGDGALAGSGVIAASISGTTADALLAPGGKSLKDLQSALDTENPHAEGGFVLPKVRVRLSTGIEHVKQTDRNVIAVLPPVGTDEYIVVGAHYDHLGRGGAGSSLQRAGEEGKVHPGADDNGSGTAVVMELAASLAAQFGMTPASPDAPRKGDPGVSNTYSGPVIVRSGELKIQPATLRRGIIFALWSGEEIGIVGSAAFCAKPPVPLAKIAAYVNFDMVGRLQENKLTLQGVGSSKVWRRLIEKRNVAAGFNLVLQDDPYLPTDTTSFYPKRIPVLNFFTGAHEDYHRPTDTAEKLDYAGTERIAKFAQQIIADVAAAPERPDLARVERREEGGSRETLRAYLGTIPDYTTEVKGVKISGVRSGSPAEKAGLQGGDTIVEFAGQKITNIYDYTYALDAVKIGQPVKIAVERDGKRVEITATPEVRK